MSRLQRTCDEKFQLIIEYQSRTASYSLAVARLAIRNIAPSEYERLSAIAEQARLASEDARERLNRHIEEHHC
jgi:hypothetical protein